MLMDAHEAAPGFAIITWNNPKKLEKPWITKGPTTPWQSLGLISSMVTVGAYGGPRAPTRKKHEKRRLPPFSTNLNSSTIREKPHDHLDVWVSPTALFPMAPSPQELVKLDDAPWTRRCRWTKKLTWNPAIKSTGRTSGKGTLPLCRCAKHRSDTRVQSMMKPSSKIVVDEQFGTFSMNFTTLKGYSSSFNHLRATSR